MLYTLRRKGIVSMEKPSTVTLAALARRGLNTQTAELPQHTFHTHNLYTFYSAQTEFISYVVLFSVYILYIVLLAVVKDHS